MKKHQHQITKLYYEQPFIKNKHQTTHTKTIFLFSQFWAINFLKKFKNQI